MTSINISRIHYPVTTLGPGRRLGIWVQGCSIRCPGCISADTWSQDKGLTTIEDIMNKIRLPLASSEGVTISGGEPFEQIEGLKALLIEIKKEFKGDILVYSGYSLEQLQNNLPPFHGLIDVLIVDPFLIESSQSLLLRGSDNQRLVYLSSLGIRKFEPYDRPLTKDDYVLDIAFDDDTGTIYLVGIPRPGDIRRLTDLLKLKGHYATSTQDKVTIT